MTHEPRPEPGDYPTQDAYLEALIRWVVRDELRKQGAMPDAP